jgi:4-aminobutyrate aminotransferase-like enzyme/Ser/Thr protein kinase RdoA (MazF antagonist)
MHMDTLPEARNKPPFDAAAAEVVALELWGIAGVASPLPSDRDRNFRLVAEGRSHVLKFLSPEEDQAFIQLQHQMMELAHKAGLSTPRPVPSRNDATTEVAVGPDGESYPVIMHAWVDGIPWAEYRPHTSELLEAAGRELAVLDKALQGFEHPAADWLSSWDLRHAHDVVESMLRHVPESRRDLLKEHMARFQGVVPNLEDLPLQIIHGDGNDYNLMVQVGAELAGGTPSIGIIDFGDAALSWRAAEIGVAAAYLTMGHADPVSALESLTAGFHRILPFTDDELTAIPHLVAARLCVSVCHSSLRSATEPDDAYQTISQAAGWELLEQLADTHPRLTTFRIRAACGLEPCPLAGGLRTWLAGSHPSPVVDVDLEGPVFDLSVGTVEFDGTLDPTDASVWENPFQDRLAESGAGMAFGRYLEPRICYRAGQFQGGGVGPERQRTIHLGVDLFAPAGTAVMSPYEGQVVSVVDNDQPLDYGPTVILQHEADGQPFWTLYGHLERSVLGRLAPGDSLAAGELFAELGSAEENGGWPPHLHFQVYADVLDATGNLPGVALASQRAVWASLSPNPELILRSGKSLEFIPADPAALREERETRFGSNLSLSYGQPLHIVRGIGARLFDSVGHAWIDGVNNVCHLGHAHPAVVRAASRQLSVLNTNTRYLHDNILRYGDALAATLPDGLDVCFLVNSGSEANDLAMRLARAATGRTGTIVLDGGYHGNLTSLVAVSSYKFDGPGGPGAGVTVEKACSPDPYRSPHRTGSDFALDVGRAATKLRERGFPPAAFMAESILSCGGQIDPPPGYLASAYAHARQAGALCIADEVQTGFGRVGHHMWSFQLQNVVPDIVTMGKPIGNGFPLGAVVTTRAIADAFANGMEYFNTYGGNPVSCAVGLAVLDTIREEGLQQHALKVGEHLKHGLSELAERYPMIGDVRGQGLFLGIEFVRDKKTLEPADAEASWIVNRMKSLGVLLSTDGPLHNVIKIKPPLAFSIEDANELLEKLDGVLRDTCLQPRVH